MQQEQQQDQQDTALNQLKTQSAISCLVRVGQLFDIAIDAQQLQHRHGNYESAYDELDIARCAGRYGFKSKWQTIETKALEKIPVPAILFWQGHYWVLEKNDAESNSWQLFNGKTQQVVNISVKALLIIEKLQVMLLNKSDVVKVNALPFGFQWFWQFIKKYRKQFRDVMIVSIFLQLFALVTPFLFQTVIDKVLVSRGLSSLHVLAIGLLSLALFEPIFTFIRSIVFSHLASRVNSELTSYVYQHLIGLPLAFFRTRQTGEIIARIREMDQVRSFMTGTALTLVLDLLFVGVFMAVMFSYAPLLAWLVIGSFVIYAGFWLCITPSLRQRVQRQYEKNADNTAFLTETVTGIETIKTSATEPQFNKQWDEKLANYVKSAFSTSLLGNIAGQGIGLIQKLFSALLLWFGVKLVLEGKLTVGELVAFNMLAGHVTMPVLRLAQVWQEFQQASISLRRVGDIMHHPAENNIQAGKTSQPTIEGEIELRKVTFRYHDDAPEALRRLDLTVKAGQMIGLTGRSGSGKSTITKLVQRLYVPQSGQVLVDGMDLALIDPALLRQNTGVVLQESFLFNGTIRENIIISNPSATEEDMINAAKLAGAHEFIGELQGGYDTPVGERGGNLSGGQRQRVAIARALINDPKILIMDEATSALDYESEQTILENMPAIAKGRTIIVIAHRLNALQHCDNILVLDKGEIAEQGTHSELVKSGGHYAELWELQTASNQSKPNTASNQSTATQAPAFSLNASFKF
ncbi:type I secretion system permease/ATPase [Spartinivicinus poritis]|uniref:Type I secretion system permease/ATPase n=1 Tax=Spartinivicinus poritis TaxID=2994640 RepID=A0ABT5UDB0_9GAMM|nr:type I secretion system permease/ATPase [Spartinivicinus sp. A2-2]MDE1464366.1 type I secretion system permease/ATPase [Spartinivicinus sp. A2-2]